MRPRGTPVALAAALLLAAGALTARPAVAGPDEEAAAHFARAEAAERRRDWRTAIREYELAYDASPHPSVLYNLGRSHEQVGEPRRAAEYFRRYLIEDGEPDDRAAVEQRIAGLRDRPSRVAVSSAPSGLALFVDGERAGVTPATLTLPAGPHTLHVATSGRAAPTRAVKLEYGEPAELHFDLAAGHGTLIVAANVEGAEVRVDGAFLGQAPLSAAVTAGPHRVTVSRAGYLTVERQVTLAADGSEQIRAMLVSDGVTPPESAPAGRPSGFFGVGYGADLRDETYRYLLALGVRAASERWEAAFVFGAYQGGGGLGGELRLFAATGRLRPYLRGAALIGTTAADADERTYGFEGGLGLLVAGSSLRGVASVDYFVEVDAHLAVGGPATSEPQRLGVPLVGGIIIRYSSGERR